MLINCQAFTLSGSQFCAQMYKMQHGPITVTGSGMRFSIFRSVQQTQLRLEEITSS